MAALASAPEVSVEQYLHTVYEPDMDLVDGVLENRNVGEFDHARLQRALLFALAKGEEQGGHFVVQESRMQVSANRYRVPDTCVLRSDRLPDRIITQAPLLCVEVLSPEDRVTRLQRRCKDYLDMGVAEVWVLDPGTRIAYVLRGETMTEHRGGVLRLAGTNIELGLAELFAKLD